MTAYAFSAAGVVVGDVQDQPRSMKMVAAAKVTVAAAETVTVTHGQDDTMSRRVLLVNSATGVVTAPTSVTMTATTTAVVVAAAGTYWLTVEV